MPQDAEVLLLRGPVPVRFSSCGICVAAVCVGPLIRDTVWYVVNPAPKFGLHGMGQRAVALRIWLDPVAPGGVGCGAIGRLSNPFERRPLSCAGKDGIVHLGTPIAKPTGNEEPQAADSRALNKRRKAVRSMGRV